MSRCVFITGGSRGIGLAIKDLFLSRGYQVISPTRQELDLSAPDAVQHFLADHAWQVDVLINNASENKIAEISELHLADWQRMQNINLTAPFLLLKGLTPHMVSQRWGRVINIASCYSVVSRAGRAAYTATKSGLVGLTRTAALEYAPHNILVNSICPGFVETDMTRQNNLPAQIEQLCRQVPQGRLAQPEEVAKLVFFLASEENSYITGQNMAIDGGFLCQ